MTGYVPVAIYLVLIIGFGVVSLAAARLLRPSRPLAVKSDTYECGAEPVGEGVRLRVRTPTEGRQAFELSAELAAEFPAHLGLVSRLPMQFQPTCACDQPQLQQVLGDTDLVAVVCPQCGLVWAAQPVPDEQLQVLALDEAARDQFWQEIGRAHV